MTELFVVQGPSATLIKNPVSNEYANAIGAAPSNRFVKLSILHGDKGKSPGVSEKPNRQITALS